MYFGSLHHTYMNVHVHVHVHVHVESCVYAGGAGGGSKTQEGESQERAGAGPRTARAPETASEKRPFFTAVSKTSCFCES